MRQNIGLFLEKAKNGSPEIQEFFKHTKSISFQNTTVGVCKQCTVTEIKTVFFNKIEILASSNT